MGIFRIFVTIAPARTEGVKSSSIHRGKSWIAAVTKSSKALHLFINVYTSVNDDKNAISISVPVLSISANQNDIKNTAVFM